ncbi:MAG: hypothetical protein AUJ74_00515 [Candidatus Omnitrophica bacterium CG1_02_44_16]|nr:MAG: hypothetical protein AUJ74_00515 [Candidatus Omnitrophica bacterium CG1_02_44_16]PIY83330.1 MAG: hypothetical protein COY78_02705 [Candidatus Omnitrophica bacterium CG_4_10_14_0_8_um_filter_44_12]PIZ83021.1 MAG: hypothetical protein COX96_09375 [Candidatus Omnitrophica bacterium CG_4_10_14_0_2_um_filter_44_9]
MNWDKTTEGKFKLLIDKMPIFLRGTASAQVSKKAQNLAEAANRQEITEQDMVNAFFAQTPFGFQGLMKNDLIDVGIDYTKYGHAK